MKKKNLDFLPRSLFFTDSDQSRVGHRGAMSVCLCVCLFVRAIAKHPKAVSLILAITQFYVFFSVSMILSVFNFFSSHPSVDQPIVDNGEARRWSYVAVVIIVSDKWHRTHETWHRTGNRRHMIQMTWHTMKRATNCVKVPKRVIFLMFL